MAGVRLSAFFLLGVTSALVASGCGQSTPENLGRVSGQVTLDGQPLPGALLTFVPVTPGGSTSLGKTNESGDYTLSYSGSINGAEIGQHRVTITTYSGGDTDAEPPQPKVPEKVPAKYNYQSELTAEVKAGSNTIDFPLKNDGPIMAVPPESGDGCGGQ